MGQGTKRGLDIAKFESHRALLDTQSACMTKKTREQTLYTTDDDCRSKELVEERPITEVTCPLLVVERGRSALGESCPT